MLKIVEVSSEERFEELRQKENSNCDYLYICKYCNAIKLSDNGELKTLDGISISDLEGNAIQRQEDGSLYVEDKTAVIQQLETITNSISKSQKYLNTELDYCYLTVLTDANITITKDLVIPFSYINGNMSFNETVLAVKLKAGKTYRISCDIYTTSTGGSSSGWTNFIMYDITNEIQLKMFTKAGANFSIAASNVGSEFVYIPDIDCEIQVRVQAIGGTQMIDTTQRNYFIVEEIGRQTVVDPVEHVNTTQGIEDAPVGHIISYMSTVAPKHYLVCDGAEYNIANYPYLAQHIKNSYGSVNYFGGDGIDTFCVPQTIENVCVNSNNSTNKKFITIEFAELSGYTDSVHIANMTITQGEQESVTYFTKLTDNKYLVAKKFTAKVIGLVDSYKTATGGTTSEGTFYQYRNNTLFKSMFYKADSNTVGSKGTAEDVFEFEKGDVFYFNTPSSNGWPQQYGTIIIDDGTVESITCIKCEPTYFMNVFGLREETVLFEGDANAVGTYELADSVKNYDEIYVVANLYKVNENTQSQTIRTKDIILGTSGYLFNFAANSSSFRYIQYRFNDYNNLTITAINNCNLPITITKIIGIKYRTTAEGTISI